MVAEIWVNEWLCLRKDKNHPYYIIFKEMLIWHQIVNQESHYSMIFLLYLFIHISWPLYIIFIFIFIIIIIIIIIYKEEKHWIDY